MLENSHSKWHELMQQAEKWACKPSPPDPRDYSLSRLTAPVATPPSVRMDNLFKIRDQKT